MGLSTGLALLAAVQVLSPSAALQEAFQEAPAGLTGTPVTWRLGPQHPDLIRYNRVEALSLGARIQFRPATPLGPLSVATTAQMGIADVHPNGRLELERETLDRRVSVRGYHELASIDERARHFRAGNSLSALLWGQDDGDYFRRSGVALEVTPPTAEPRSFRVVAFAEYHEAVAKETDWHVASLWDGDGAMRPNLVADEGWEVGARADVVSRSGTDRTRPRGEVRWHALAVTGRSDFARASAGAAAAFPLPARLGLSFEVEGGSIWGPASVQRLWYVGGPASLRGYEPRALGGKAFVRGRAELSRRYAFGRLVVFSDIAWAGEPERFELDRALRSAGVGLALADGLARFDGAWQLEEPHRFRLDMYLHDPL